MKKLAIIAAISGAFAVSAFGQSATLPVSVTESSYKAVVWTVGSGPFVITPVGTYSDTGPNTTDHATAQTSLTAYANNSYSLSVSIPANGGNVSTQNWSISPTALATNAIATNGLLYYVNITDSFIQLADGLGAFTNTATATIS